MPEVLGVHAVGMARQRLAIFLVALFCAMSYSPMVDANPPSRQVDVVIGLGPEGMSDKFFVEVPDGESLQNSMSKLLRRHGPLMMS